MRAETKSQNKSNLVCLLKQTSERSISKLGLQKNRYVEIRVEKNLLRISLEKSSCNNFTYPMNRNNEIVLLDIHRWC